MQVVAQLPSFFHVALADQQTKSHEEPSYPHPESMLLVSLIAKELCYADIRVRDTVISDLECPDIPFVMFGAP